MYRRFQKPISLAQSRRRHHHHHHQNTLIISLLDSVTEIVQVHAHMIKTALDTTPFPLSKLLASTSILDISYASKIFNDFPNPNLFMFNTLLKAYSISDNPKQTLFIFNNLRAQHTSLDQFSFICTLKACARDAHCTGFAVHGVVLQSGFDYFINVRNTLLQIYSVFGRIGDAHQLFDMFPEQRDLVSWNILMGGYIKISQPLGVIKLFTQIHTNGLDVSTTTVLSVLSACGDLKNLCEGQALHGYCVKKGFRSELNVVTAIVAMYSRNGCMGFARKVFDGVINRDVVLWNCIIEGYAGNGFLEESLSLLRLMKVGGLKPNSVTVAGVLRACASSGALVIGESIHNYTEEESLQLDEVLGTALLDMYSKCGAVEKALNVFEQMQSKDVRAWTAMVAGFGVNGQSANAVTLFEKMEAMSVVPNEVTFLAVLNACSHGAMVTQGKYWFERMVRVYEFLPGIEHYGCMIDLLGRAGLLEEAYELIESLPIERDTTAWRALLAACRVHANVKLGEIVKRRLVELNDVHPTDSILLSSSYAIQGRWDDIAKIREGSSPTRKEVGWSSIELRR